MNTNSNHKINGLGADWGGIFQTGAGIFDSIMDSRTANKSNESMERQLELQLQAQREQSQTDSARFGQITKMIMIAGSVLLVGGLIFTIAKFSSSKEKAAGNLGKKKKDLARLEILDGLVKNRQGKRTKKNSAENLKRAA